MSWDEVKNQISSARTSDERRRAVEAMMQHIPQEKQQKLMVTMGQNGLNAVSLGSLPSAVATNTDLFNKIKHIVTGL